MGGSCSVTVVRSLYLIVSDSLISLANVHYRPVEYPFLPVHLLVGESRGTGCSDYVRLDKAIVVRQYGPILVHTYGMRKYCDRKPTCTCFYNTGTWKDFIFLYFSYIHLFIRYTTNMATTKLTASPIARLRIHLQNRCRSQLPFGSKPSHDTFVQ